MVRLPSLRQTACAVCLVLVSAGCGSEPTYPKARLAASLQQILAEEHLDASVRFVDHTLAVQLRYPAALMQQDGAIELGPDFDTAARKVITALHRVLLSSDAPVRFYLVLLSDPKVPGAYLTLVRYVDDVKRANASMLDTPEFFARTILELNVARDTDRPLTLEQYVPRDIRLEEFLSWQLARRIQNRLTEELEQAGVATVGRCTGHFQDGEFAFTLDVTPPAPALTSDGPGPAPGALDDGTLQRAFEASSTVIAKVLSGYHFEAFNSVRLIHPLSGRNLVLPKTHLDVFR